MKKIMFLGGSIQQLPAIQYAKKQGYYTVLCDYLQDNPGQFYSDEFHCVSTTDKDAILKISMQESIEGIVAYASDPAAATAAFVSNKLNLPSNSYESVLVLSKKDLFRNFLINNGFNCPKAKSFNTVDEAKKSLSDFQFPLIVKPTDSSGSKGVSRIDINDELDYAFDFAISNSINKTVIIEEFIEMVHEYMIGGDIFVINGKIEFFGLLNCHRNNEINPLVPIGKSHPLLIEEEKLDLVRKELQKVISLLEIKVGALNIEVMFSKDGKLYIIEMGPRNGGNMIPQLLEIITGVNLVKATVEAALGNNKDINVGYSPQTNSYFSTYILHSSKKGILKNIIFTNEIQRNIINKFIFKELNEEVDIFDSSNKAIGIIFLEYSSLEELNQKMKNMNQYIEVQVMD
ncbi:acetyl-CoA carboxylase biotin carboxylase subunit family protein [Psychrobacillus sp. FJAT-21963]|uniref:ATP-grasp domain-containing protein n=1 Tax=Psychrobacillus sp. FJAT-21963 TaxID=1712028 RepID=UPI00070054AB|nr:ATP-grasp domain-containing protein [Psychrobacillus sp. FJAT-21963]KQL33386.1 carbamoyl-phosphate-synthetase [Psychrobacillus sp. FJAT-21963]